ncbi:hypothetical protein C4Q31_14660 [Leptospira borgpetersenii serovar Ceylonica]|nr:hypothetical protein C4Q31_14660 [Leptospira borgpetersenii serovar Ceylonica]
MTERFYPETRPIESVSAPNSEELTTLVVKSTRPIESHNLTHKYLDLKINLSELLQILCETYAPP